LVQDHQAQELESGQAPEQALAQELGQEQEQEQAEPNSAASMGGPGISRPRPEPR
jgi:hypothetical protein